MLVTSDVLAGRHVRDRPVQSGLLLGLTAVGQGGIEAQ